MTKMCTEQKIFQLKTTFVSVLWRLNMQRIYTILDIFLAILLWTFYWFVDI